MYGAIHTHTCLGRLASNDHKIEGGGEEEGEGEEERG